MYVIKMYATRSVFCYYMGYVCVCYQYIYIYLIKMCYIFIKICSTTP